MKTARVIIERCITGGYWISGSGLAAPRLVDGTIEHVVREAEKEVGYAIRQAFAPQSLRRE